MPTKPSTSSWFLSLLAAAWVFSACHQNENLDIDLDLNQFVSDTLRLDNLEMKTLREDSQRTDNLSFQLLGNINDSVFGASRAAIYTQFLPTGVLDIPANAEPDSVVMQLSLVDYYGNIASAQHLSVFLLADSMGQDQQYYTTSTIPRGTKVGGSQYQKLKNGLGLRMSLADLWGQKGIGPASYYTTVSHFKRDMPGLAIISESEFGNSDGAIAYYNLANANSFLEAHYHYYVREGDLLVRKTGVVKYTFGSSCRSFTSLGHAYQGELVEPYLHPDSNHAFRGFVQALGGSNVSIDLLPIKQLADSDFIALHKVELVLPCELGYHNNQFKPMPFLDLKTIGEDGKEYDLADRSNPYWSRAYNADLQAYVFNITSHAQQLLMDNRHNPGYDLNELVVKAVKTEPVPFSAGRVVLKGPRSLRQDGAYLQLYYSKLGKP